jgi:hypothetical protein
MSTDTRADALERRIQDLYGSDPQFAAARPDEAVSAAIARPGLRLPQLERQHAVLPVPHYYQQPEKPLRGAMVSTERFRAAVQEAKVGPEKDIPHLTAELIVKYITDLGLLGLLWRKCVAESHDARASSAGSIGAATMAICGPTTPRPLLKVPWSANH